MMTGGQIGDFLLEHQHDKIYVGIDGMEPKLVGDFSEAIVNGGLLDDDLGFVFLEGLKLHTVDRISLVGRGKGGFAVKEVVKHEDGYWLVFSIFVPKK